MLYYIKKADPYLQFSYQDSIRWMELQEKADRDHKFAIRFMFTFIILEIICILLG